MSQLWEQFRSETRTSYEFYRRQVDPRVTEKARGPGRVAWVIRDVFWAMLMKLSPPRRVALLLALAVVMVGALQFRYRDAAFQFDLRSLGVLLLFILLGLELADRVTMKRDLEIAREIQHWLVPESPPTVPGVDVAFMTRPANTVAGDYYDAFFLDSERNRLLLVVADVAGKSVPAALLMATFQASLHSFARDCDTPAVLAERLNQFACSRSLDGKRFTTAFISELRLDGLSLAYVNAGHNPPVLQRARGLQERLERGGLPFGIDSAARYESGATRLEPGDLLFIFSDGLVEANNGSEEQYGDPRLLEALNTMRGAGAAATMNGMIESVDSFSAGARQYDDITCLAARME